MKPLRLASALLALLLASVAAAAQSNVDAAGRAKIIAPLIEEGTIAVVHVDLSRALPQPLLDWLNVIRLGPPLESWTGHATALSRAGVRDVYLVAPNIVLAMRQPRILMVIPVSSAEQEQTVRTNLHLENAQTRRTGDTVVIATQLPPPKEFRAVERPELAAAFAAAGDTAAQVIVMPPADTPRVVEELMPQLPAELGGGPSSVLSRGIRWAAVGIDVAPRKAVRLVIQSQDAQAAEALREKLVGLLSLAAALPDVRKQVPDFQAVAAFLAPKVEGDRLTVASDDKTESFERAMAAIMQPMLSAEARMASSNDLKRIGLALLTYEQANKVFPLPASRAPDGKPLLSWRVHILPYLGEKSLYQQFHLDEPWDGPHNRPLLEKMPSVYRLTISKSQPGRTNYLLPVGNGAAFDAERPTAFKDIKDGSSNTIMVVTVDDDHAAIWTKPDDWRFDPQQPTVGWVVSSIAASARRFATARYTRSPGRKSPRTWPACGPCSPAPAAKRSAGRRRAQGTANVGVAVVLPSLFRWQFHGAAVQLPPQRQDAPHGSIINGSIARGRACRAAQYESAV